MFLFSGEHKRNLRLLDCAQSDVLEVINNF
jgi:hypothetical protein